MFFEKTYDNTDVLGSTILNVCINCSFFSSNSLKQETGLSYSEEMNSVGSGNLSCARMKCQLNWVFILFYGNGLC